MRWDWVRDHGDDILAATRQHVELTLLAVALGLLLSFPLGLVARRWRRSEAPILGLTGGLFTIPSLALFALLVPFTGLSRTTAEIGLVSYTLLILVRNTVTGLEQVPDEVRDAADGMGLSRRQRLWKVEMPLALPSIMAGIRIATVSTIALVTVGATVGYGGFGALILNGFNNNFYRAEIATGALACVALALLADGLLLGAARLLSPWSRARSA